MPPEWEKIIIIAMKAWDNLGVDQRQYFEGHFQDHLMNLINTWHLVAR